MTMIPSGEGAWRRGELPAAHNRGRVRPRLAAAADALVPPAGLEPRDVQRILDLESLRESAPDLAEERLLRIATIRQQLREGTYLSSDRLQLALERAIAASRRR